MAKLWWLIAGLGLALPVWAQSRDGTVSTEIACDERGTNCRAVVARIALPGGIAADLALRFGEASGLDSESLDIAAELVDPRDPQLGGRLPASTFIPSDFPVLVRIEPNAGIDLAFRGQWNLELVTENLEFSSHTPFRLFHAPDGGSFRDITLGLGSGSLRVFAGGDDFSELLVVADLRPFDAVIARKLDRLALVLESDAGALENVLDELQGLLAEARSAFESSDLSGAIAAVGQLLAFVRERSGTEIPDTTEPGAQRVGAAGKLLAAGSTLAHSLFLGLQSAQGGRSGFTERLQIDEERFLEVAVRFEEAFEADPAAFDLEAELIDVSDPALLARLPAGVQIPAKFPVLLKITPDGNRDQAFSGMYEIELKTESLSFLGGAPLRLFKAPEGGAFEDITRSLGLGSLRVFAGGDDFSEFLIAADLRPVTEIAGTKLERLEASLERNAGAIPASVRQQLEGLLAQVRQEVEQGRDLAAIVRLDQLANLVERSSGEDIPSLWRSNEPLSNVAGELRALSDTLRFSLSLRSQPTVDPADVNRDGRVDVGDVLHLIDRVFREP